MRRDIAGITRRVVAKGANLRRLLSQCLRSCLASSRLWSIVRGLDWAVDRLLVVQPVWTLAAAALVFSSYWLQLGAAIPWVGLALAFLPFPVRLARQGNLRLRTPFDLAFAAVAVGALTGLIVSPNTSLSLGAFQSVLAASLAYYACVNHPQPGTMLKQLLPLGLLFVLGQAVFAAVESANGSSGAMPCTYHGLALSLVIVATILTGVAMGGGRGKRRAAVGLLSLSVYVGVFSIVHESVPRLLSWEAVSGRIPRWGATIDLLAGAPFTGLGLGCWAQEYHGTEVISHPTHAHNAYLELYANFGVLGLLALSVTLAVGAKLALDIIRSPRSNPWYGFGVGVVLTCAATLLVGVVESCPVGVPLVRADTYYYIISPAPLVLMGLLVIAHRMIREPDVVRNGRGLVKTRWLFKPADKGFLHKRPPS